MNDIDKAWMNGFALGALSAAATVFAVILVVEALAR